MLKRGRPLAPHRCMQRPTLGSRMRGVTGSRVTDTPAVRSPASSRPQLPCSSLVTRETSRIHGITLLLRLARGTKRNCRGVPTHSSEIAGIADNTHRERALYRWVGRQPWQGVYVTLCAQDGGQTSGRASFSIRFYRNQTCNYVALREYTP